jgi:hypothetical protein
VSSLVIVVVMTVTEQAGGSLVAAGIAPQDDSNVEGGERNPKQSGGSLKALCYHSGYTPDTAPGRKEVTFQREP